jgi:hypothetical protein
MLDILFLGECHCRTYLKCSKRLEGEMYGKFNSRILVLGVHMFHETYCRVLLYDVNAALAKLISTKFLVRVKAIFQMLTQSQVYGTSLGLQLSE